MDPKNSKEYAQLGKSWEMQIGTKNKSSWAHEEFTLDWIRHVRSLG